MRRLAWLCVPLIAILAGCAGSDSTAPFNRIWGSGEDGIVNGDAIEARFSNPANVEVAADGTVYVADYDNDAVRVIATNGLVDTLVFQNNFQRPFGMTIGPDGFLYVQTDGNDLGERNANTGTIWKINRTTGDAEVVVRDIGRPRGLQALPDGRIAMADVAHHTIRILTPGTGSIDVIAGANDTPGFINGNGATARFSRPYGLGLLPDGALLVADQDNNVLRRVTLTGDTSTYAGTGAMGALNGTRAAATFNRPQDVAIVGNNIFVADHDNHLIRKISGDTVSTFAGNGNAGFVDATGLSAEFFGLEGLALNNNGSILWIADGNNGEGDPFNRVRRLQTN